ncbi:hypothetical protein DBR11_27755 [Pedobacter sp. HMWF019]|uniref:glycosyltransferase family 4 protein n=1 Tax=Pedobacter sp. HMWF019 TaxID=2056856 RepID=UPI000D34BCE1|nr:glycosyltransferase family 4 protein [Pedobacter sp. HMWF019]PTS91998.1 hypothetical protein DBR11_27755 [Pedobacter sp. HMWF019]
MKRKHDILFLTLSSFCDTGGIQKVCRTLSKALSDICAERNSALQVFSLKDQTTQADSRYIPSAQFKGFNNQKLLFTLHAIAKSSSHPNILLSHIHLLPIALMIKILRPNTRIILLAHGIEIWGKLSKWKVLFIKQYIQIWCVSHFTAETIKKKHGITGQNAFVLNNCLDPYFNIPGILHKPGYLLSHYNLQPAQPLLLSICRLGSNERDKGYLNVIRILKRLRERFPNICYLLGGLPDKEEKAFLQELIRKESLQNHIKIIGFIPEKTLTDHYLLCDIFVLPSKKEGFGLVFTEAAATGCRIICGNKDGSKEAIANGALGTLIDPDDLETLHHTILSHLEEATPQETAYARQHLCLLYFNYPQYKYHLKNLLDRD